MSGVEVDDGHSRDGAGLLVCPDMWREPHRTDAGTALWAVRCPHLVDVIRYEHRVEQAVESGNSGPGGRL